MSHSKGFYTTLDQDIEEVQYLDKSFDKVDTNFVNIENLCEKCGASVSLKFQLHKHLKDGYAALAHFLLPDASAISLISFIPVVALKSVISVMGSDLAFWDRTNVTVTITLVSQNLFFDSDTNAIACLNTGCNITFVNKFWLL